MTHGGASGGVVVGDPARSPPSASGGLNLPPMPGKPGASLELLTNSQGVDFRPYLIQVLAKVKLSWFNVWPQSARMGRQGRVTIQFAIDRNGFRAETGHRLGVRYRCPGSRGGCRNQRGPVLSAVSVGFHRRPGKAAVELRLQHAMRDFFLSAFICVHPRLMIP